MTDHGGYTCLTFLTDYGTQDGFVAACRAQMLRHAPAPVIDITRHPAWDVRRGATVLADTVSSSRPRSTSASSTWGGDCGAVALPPRPRPCRAGQRAAGLGGGSPRRDRHGRGVDQRVAVAHPAPAFHGRDIYAVGARSRPLPCPKRAGPTSAVLVRLSALPATSAVEWPAAKRTPSTGSAPPTVATRKTCGPLSRLRDSRTGWRCACRTVCTRSPSPQRSARSPSASWCPHRLGRAAGARGERKRRQRFGLGVGRRSPVPDQFSSMKE